MVTSKLTGPIEPDGQGKLQIQPDDVQMNNVRIVYVSAGVLMREDGRLLVAQRPQGKAMAGLWELPGGKIEAGETPEAALVRELREELGVQIDAAHLKPLTFASHGYESFHLVMPVFLATEWQGTPEPQEGQSLDWVQPDQLKSLPAPEADIPLFDFIERQFPMGTA